MQTVEYQVKWEFYKRTTWEPRESLLQKRKDNLRQNHQVVPDYKDGSQKIGEMKKVMSVVLVKIKIQKNADPERGSQKIHQ